jgi:hypothetical protein
MDVPECRSLLLDRKWSMDAVRTGRGADARGEKEAHLNVKRRLRLGSWGVDGTIAGRRRSMGHSGRAVCDKGGDELNVGRRMPLVSAQGSVRELNMRGMSFIDMSHNERLRMRTRSVDRGSIWVGDIMRIEATEGEEKEEKGRCAKGNERRQSGPWDVRMRSVVEFSVPSVG